MVESDILERKIYVRVYLSRGEKRNQIVELTKARLASAVL